MKPVVYRSLFTGFTVAQFLKEYILPNYTLHKLLVFQVAALDLKVTEVKKVTMTFPDCSSFSDHRPEVNVGRSVSWSLCLSVID